MRGSLPIRIQKLELTNTRPHYGYAFDNKTWSDWRIDSGRVDSPMLLISIAWLYVVLMVAVVEATSSTGTFLGAFFTFVLYGLLPLGIVGYLFLSPARRRARRADEEAASLDAPGTDMAPSAVDPDQGSHAPGDTITPVRKES